MALPHWLRAISAFFHRVPPVGFGAVRARAAKIGFFKKEFFLSLVIFQIWNRDVSIYWSQEGKGTL